MRFTLQMQRSNVLQIEADPINACFGSIRRLHFKGQFA
jgi:hypothetical protein